MEKISNAPIIASDNASTFNSYENTLESVVNYFFASQIRKDKEWEKVVPSLQDRTESMQQKLQKYETWTVTKFQLSGKVEYERGKFWVFIKVEVIIDGKTNYGKSRVEVELINDKLIITDIPA